MRNHLLCLQAINLQLCVLHVQSCLKICVFGGVCLEGVHPSVNETLAKDLQSSNPSLEVLRTSVKPLKLVKPEYEHGFNSFHEVRPQFVLEIVYALVGVSQSLPFKERFVSVGFSSQS